MKKFKILTVLVLLISLSACKMSKEIVADIEEDLVAKDFKEDIWYLEVNRQKEIIQLFVKEIGTGEPVVVLHGGFGAEHSYLTDLLDPLYSDFHFIYYDQRGSLRSPVKNDSLITAQSHIDDLEKLRKELKLDKMNILGHSMGTWIASAYMEQYPQHVEKMTLLGLVWPKPNMNVEEQKLNVKSEQGFSKFLERPEIEQELMEEGFNKSELSSKEKTYKWRIKFTSASVYDVSKWRQMKGGWVFYNQESGTASGSTMPQDYNWIDVYKDHPEIKITVINGTHDFVDFGGSLQGRWLRPLPNVDYHLIQNAGHNAWIDEPYKVMELVKKGLGKNSSPLKTLKH